MLIVLIINVLSKQHVKPSLLLYNMGLSDSILHGRLHMIIRLQSRIYCTYIYRWHTSVILLNLQNRMNLTPTSLNWLNQIVLQVRVTVTVANCEAMYPQKRACIR